MMSQKVLDARQEIVRLNLLLGAINEDRKGCKADLKLAELRFFKLIDDEAAGVQDLPLGEPDDDDALNRRLEELSAEANGEPAWLEDYVARDMMARIAPDQATNREPEHDGEPIEDDDDGPLLPSREAERALNEATVGLSDQQEEEDALAKIEADAQGKPKRRRKAKAQ